MKLCAIFNVWDDFDMLDHSTRAIEGLVDGIIVVASTHSNYGEFSPIPDRWKGRVVLREPRFNIPMHSETDKRNYGLELARKAGYTHFITMDADEFYIPEEFLKIRDWLTNKLDVTGIVCPVIGYFRLPTLCFGRDVTLVPHIHKLTPTIKHEFNRKYPHSWQSGQVKIDPSRSLNINSDVFFTEEIEMHHMTYIRKDIDKKIRNSSARANIEKSTLREDYLNAAPGYYCRYYQSVLKECPNYFNIV